jgi:hypothetical protein
MAQPTPFDRLYNFNDWQTVNPTKPLPATELDAELNAIELTTDQIRQNLALIQRDDGKLANQAVTPESLSSGTLAMINQGEYNPRGEWVTATAYAVGDIVTYNLASYLCLTAHTSAALFPDDSANWLLIANAALSGEENALDKFIGDGVETDFTLSLNYAGPEAVAAYVNGVLQVPGQGYTLTGLTISFVVPPPAPAVPGDFNVVVRGNAVTAQALTDAAILAAQAALASEQAAAASEVAAVAAYDAFDDRYLGAKAGDPALDNDGNALMTGALYWNTTIGQMRVYSGTAWVPQPSTSALLDQTFSGTGAQTAFTLTSATGAALNLEVFISGVRQVPGTNYTVSGSTLTFVAAPPAGTNNIYVRWAQLLQEVSTAAFTLQEVTPTAGQTVITATSPYVPGSNNLAVYLNGLRQSPGDDFVETNSTTVTFTSALANTDKVLLVIGTTINESVGAQQVGYTPPGTGAVATNVQAKLREFVSVKDFGADPTGVIDATTAIQNALNTGKKVFLPKGNYLISAPLEVPTHGGLIGEGSSQYLPAAFATDPAVRANSSVLTAAVGFPTGRAMVEVSTAAGADFAKQCVELRDFVVFANSNAEKGIELRTVKHSVLDGITIWLPTQIGLNVFCNAVVDATVKGNNAVQFNNFRNIICYVAYNGFVTSARGIVLDGQTNNNVNQNLWENIYVVHGNGTGIDIIDADTDVWMRVNTMSWGTGYGCVLWGSDVDANIFARANSFFGVQFSGAFGQGGVLAKAGTVVSSKLNIMFGYSVENGSPAPEIEDGARMVWHTEDAPFLASNTFAQQYFDRTAVFGSGQSIARKYYRGKDVAGTKVTFLEEQVFTRGTVGAEYGEYRLLGYDSGSQVEILKVSSPFGLSVGGGAGIKKILTATANLDFPSISAGSSFVLTISVPGASVGDTVSLGLPANGFHFQMPSVAYVSAADTVSVRLFNISSGALDMASQAVRVTVFGF